MVSNNVLHKRTQYVYIAIRNRSIVRPFSSMYVEASTDFPQWPTTFLLYKACGYETSWYKVRLLAHFLDYYTTCDLVSFRLLLYHVVLCFQLPLFFFLFTGPDNVYRTDRPQHSRFTWDLRNCPRTNGRGNQEPYATAVRRWCSYNDALTDGNQNKIPKNLRGLTLHAQLYDRAFDLRPSIPDEIPLSNAGVDAVVNNLYKREALSIVNALFEDFSTLLSTKRGNNELFKKLRRDSLLKFPSSVLMVILSNCRTVLLPSCCWQTPLYLMPNEYPYFLQHRQRLRRLRIRRCRMTNTSNWFQTKALCPW